MLAEDPVCRHCGAVATQADHVPPVALHRHTGDDAGCCVLVPSCKPCSDSQGHEVKRLLRRLREGREEPQTTIRPSEPKPAVLEASSPVWDVLWLEPLRQVPDDARWPRFMSAPH